MTKNLNKLAERKVKLEGMKFGGWRPIQHYLHFKSQSEDEQIEMKRKNNKYLWGSEQSPAGLMYWACRKALKANNMARLKELASEARLMLANGDYEKAPYPYDPSTISNDFFVRMYIDLEKILKKDYGELEADIANTIL